MEPQVTAEQLKSLKLFSLYLRAYGVKTATKYYSIEYCQIDYEDDTFQSPDTSISIETYERIDEVLNEIIEVNELIERSTTDCDLRGTLTLEIDCIKRVLTATAGQWEYSSNSFDFSKTLEEISEDYSEEMYNEVVRLFEEIGEDGEAEVKFSGGGDDGSLDSDMYINGEVKNIPSLIKDMLYEWLNETDIDWYNNDGGQGSFIFIPKDSEIILNLEQNYEESVNVPLNFEIAF